MNCEGRTIIVVVMDAIQMPIVSRTSRSYSLYVCCELVYICKNIKTSLFIRIVHVHESDERCIAPISRIRQPITNC